MVCEQKIGIRNSQGVNFARNCKHENKNVKTSFMATTFTKSIPVAQLRGFAL